MSRACAPALQSVLSTEETEHYFPLFAWGEKEAEEVTTATEVIDAVLLKDLPSRYKDAVEQAVMLLKFFQNKEGMKYAPLFQALLGSLDEAARGLITRKLIDELPATVPEQKAWFDPYLESVDRRTHRHYQQMAQKLKRTLVFKNGLSRRRQGRVSRQTSAGANLWGSAFFRHCARQSSRGLSAVAPTSAPLDR